MNEARSIVPVIASSTELTRLNALKHGVLSQYTVLPWEDAGEYQILLASLAIEHEPEGPTEEHLVEELAGIFWRKRRLRLAEGAAHRHGLLASLAPNRRTAEAAVAHLDTETESEHLAEAVSATATDTAEQLADLEEDESMTRRAIEAIGSKKPDQYQAALALLREDTQEWWEDHLEAGTEEDTEGKPLPKADEDGLRQFLEGDVMSWYEARRRELTLRPIIRQQALGEAVDPDRLERLGRYEVHLDRKLERILAMLIRLKGLRHEAVDS